MSQVTDKTFGPLVAYLLPGFFTLIALSRYSVELRIWIGTPAENSPTVGGFLYATLASIAAGMVISAARWLLLDTLHHQTGIQRPDLEFSRLQRNLAAFQAAVENHYRFYQFYGNTLVAAMLSCLLRQPLFGLAAAHSPAGWFATATLVFLLFLASRDSLRKYYARTSAVLGLRNRTGAENDERVAS